jgi:recombination protein RecA
VSAGLRGLAAFAEAQGNKYGGERVRNRFPPVIVSTGSASLDWALRVGGYMRGQIYEIFGAPNSGKSTLGIAGLIEFLRMYPHLGVGYINMENTFDPDRATAMGLDCSDEARKSGRWHPRIPDHSEHVSDMALDLITSGFISCVVIDSIGAMESAKVLNMAKGADKAADMVGRNAKIITQMTKALATTARNNQCTVLLVNQPRANIGGFGGDISAGPKIIQHASTVKLSMSALGEEEDIRKLKLPGEAEPQIVSSRMRVRVPRMKNGLAGRVAEFYVNRITTGPYGPAGIDRADELISVGVREKVIAQGGGWYTLPDGKTKYQGRDKLAAAIRSDEGLQRLIRASIQFDTPTDMLTEFLEDS